MKKYLLFIYDFFKKMTITKHNRITIVERSFPSGSNTKIIYEELLNKKLSYDIKYVDIQKQTGYISKIKNDYFIASAKIIIGTHGIQKSKKKQVLINLWHGIPLKSMNYMEKEIKEYVKFNDDYLITNSKFESVLLASTMFIPFQKHLILGSPRLDYFKKYNNFLDILEKKYTNIIIYLPTFRAGYLNRTEGFFTGNLFNFKEIDYCQLEKFLIEENILLITKYHPLEENKLDKKLNEIKNVFNLTNEFLIENDFDLYEILRYTDLLISDYSSVYFDYLLLDKPIIFTPTDLNEYAADRGFLLEPYNNWTPGDKAITQNELQNAIISNLKNDEYKLERKKMKEILFKEETNIKYSNTEKLIELINSIMQDKQSN